MKLKVENLHYSINGTLVLNGVDIEVKKGEFVGLIGPNGSGKSTVLKNIYRVYKPSKGEIFLDKQTINKISSKDMARKMAVMIQENNVEFDIKVIDMVMLGRYSHKKLLEKNNNNDYEVAKNSLDEVGLLGYEDRSFLSLSGGEKQRVLVARALTQQAEFVVLDEPTNHLDIKYQLQIMNILKKQNITVFSSIHDLNIAAFYCDKIFAINKGKIVEYGTPEKVINKTLIRELFEVEADISINEKTGKINISYIPEF